MIRKHLAGLLVFAALASGTRLAQGEDETEAWARARQRIAPLVVTVVVKDAEGTQVEQGTGFLASKETVATSRHLFRRGVAADVLLKDGMRVEVEGVRGADPANDLVLLAVPVLGDRAVSFGESARLEAGTPLAILGSPLGVPQTLTVGTFTKRTNFLGVVGFLESTAAMEHGASGSPLFDREGRVVGLAAARRDESGVPGFAIPAERVRALLTVASTSAEVRPFGRSATFLDADEWKVQVSEEMRAVTAVAERGDAQALAEAMKKVVAKYPKSALALWGLGIAQSSAGKDADAVDSFRKAMDLAPMYLEPACDLARILEKLGRHRDAAAAYRHAIEMESRDLGLWFGLGVALVGMGEPASAIQALEHVTEKVKDRPEAWAWLGTAYARAKRLEDARAVEKRLRADHPEAADRLLAEIERHTK